MIATLAQAAESMQGVLHGDDREFGGAVAQISLPLVSTVPGAEPAPPVTIPAPDWRPQNG